MRDRTRNLGERGIGMGLRAEDVMRFQVRYHQRKKRKYSYQELTPVRGVGDGTG